MRKAQYALIGTALAAFILPPVAIVSFRLLSSLTSVELITVVLYPILTSISVAYLFSELGRAHLATLIGEQNRTITTSLAHLAMGKIICHGTKYNVPNSGEFWNALLEKSQHRFILVGSTNKSWINKEKDQSSRLAESIVCILRSGGTVSIISRSDEEIVDETLKFFRTYVAPKLQNLSKKDRQAFEARAASAFRYITVSRTNYSAVISDDTLLLMPTMNSDEFKAESMVLEIERGINPREFSNYLGDIDRLLNREGHRIDVFENKL